MRFKNLMGTAFSRFEEKGGACYLDGVFLPNVMTYKVIICGDIPKVILEIPINELISDQIEQLEDGDRRRGCPRGPIGGPVMYGDKKATLKKFASLLREEEPTYTDSDGNRWYGLTSFTAEQIAEYLEEYALLLKK